MNYKPRYLVETTAAKHGELILKTVLETDHKSDVEDTVQGLAYDGRYGTVTDRALGKRASTPEGARARGYYVIPYSGDDIESYVRGKIDRAADYALDRLDDLTDSKRDAFEARHRDSWVRAEQALALQNGLA